MAYEGGSCMPRGRGQPPPPPPPHQERAEQALDERDDVERCLVARRGEAAREAAHRREARLARELACVDGGGVDAHRVEVHERADED